MEINLADRELTLSTPACPREWPSGPTLTRGRGSRKDPILAVAMALLLLLVACAPARQPGTLPPSPTGGDLAPVQPAEGVPVIAPTEVEPQLRNRQAFLDQLVRRYPAMLTDAPDGVTVIRYWVIDEQGRVRQVIPGPDSDAAGSGTAPAADGGARQGSQ